MVQKTTDMKTFVAKVAAGEILDETAAEQAFNIIMSGDATPAQIGGFLMGLRVRGEAVINQPLPGRQAASGQGQAFSRPKWWSFSR